MQNLESLERFIQAQEPDYTQALNEIKNGKKIGHWMWYIFPQLLGLGKSQNSLRYGIRNFQEAIDYLNHPVLGQRLITITAEVLKIENKTAFQIFDSPDDLKLKSCMTLFTLVPNADATFQAVLLKYYDGNQDKGTLDLLARDSVYQSSPPPIRYF
jgi:uncharacterized protein (DUF1810 family)